LILTSRQCVRETSWKLRDRLALYATQQRRLQMFLVDRNSD
jgi:hypothetical protein